jgi:flagellar motility protein MotE (MotC chaperone)
MMRLARDFRLIPIVLLATICLFALKVSGLIFDGGYTLAERLQGRNKTDMQLTTAESVPDYPTIVVADKQGVPVAAAARQTSQQSWAQEMFNFKDPNHRDVTGSIGSEDKTKAAPPKVSQNAPAAPKLEIAGNSYPLEFGKISSPGERAVIERLQERRTELDTRSRDIEMRESLLKAAEKRLEAKVAELKDVEARVNTAMGARDKAEADRFKSIVSMYENMKGKDAARIFDRLDLKILVDVVTQMNPRKMSEILALMSPDSAERLTVELAGRASPKSKSQNAGQLPKIEGKPK